MRMELAALLPQGSYANRCRSRTPVNNLISCYSHTLGRGPRSVVLSGIQRSPVQCSAAPLLSLAVELTAWGYFTTGLLSVPDLCTMRASFFRAAPSPGDSGENDDAASAQLVEPSGHKRIIFFFLRTGGAQQAGSRVTTMPSNLSCARKGRDGGSRAEALGHSCRLSRGDAAAYRLSPKITSALSRRASHEAMDPSITRRRLEDYQAGSSDRAVD